MERSYRSGRVIHGKLPEGVDLLAFLEDTAARGGFQRATVLALGAVKRAAFAFFEQGSRRYLPLARDEELELLNLTGLIGHDGGRPALHAHVTFSDIEGRAFGGHLLSGTVVFGGAYWFEELRETGGEDRCPCDPSPSGDPG
jgi:predicted DNA-binding protein with PD1-like motif